jgi:hypothetical protein
MATVSMPREPLYKIDKSAYLFGKGLPAAETRDQPEEAVRQWCAYELMRAYGMRITEIACEHPVKVGSKSYRIDILVSRHDSPAVVVECKPRSYLKHADAMAQAISYADAQDIKAEFAVYTNGDVWHVKRRIRERWVSIPDLPQHVDRNGAEPIAEFLLALKDVQPLLYKLGQPLVGKDSHDFLGAMQVFFCGANLLTQEVNRDLGIATDNLLRTLWAAGDSPYQDGKFATALAHFEKYRQQANIGFEIYPSRNSLRTEMQQLHASLTYMLEGAEGLSSGDLLVLRLATALLDYGQSLQDVTKPKSYPTLGPIVQEPLRDYLNYALTFHLNVALPDLLDKVWIGDMRSCCLAAWKEYVERV